MSALGKSGLLQRSKMRVRRPLNKNRDSKAWQAEQVIGGVAVGVGLDPVLFDHDLGLAVVAALNVEAVALVLDEIDDSETADRDDPTSGVEDPDVADVLDPGRSVLLAIPTTR